MSAPVRVKHEGGTASWVAGTLAVPSVQGHRLPQPQCPWVSLWFYFHLCMWVVHWGLAPEAALEGLGLPL